MVKKKWCINAMEQYSAIKKNEIMPFSKTWWTHRLSQLSKVSQGKRNIIWCHLYKNLERNDKNELIYTEIEIHSQTLENELCNKSNGKRISTRIETCICITESLHYTPETNTLQINYGSIKDKKFFNHSILFDSIGLTTFPAAFSIRL